jgi:predicted GNAT family acetyltransferase
MKYLQEESRFYVPGAPGEEDIAEITFSRAGDHLAIIDHTYVNINYRGQGIGEHLVEMVVELMRKEKREIIPLCPFAKKEFERVSSYQDIWHRP